jgi:biotin carboxyl carrier protein
MTVQLKPTDVLPPMREDLVVGGAAHPTTGDLVSVQDPRSQRVVRFRGFELSLARLLDGRRTATEVIDAARGLGIPLTLPGLQNFSAKLNSIGFLAVPGAAAAQHKTTWKPRPLWSPEVREQFRAALKDAREDRLDQARNYLEQVLKADPTVKDASELLAWIDKRKQQLAPAAAPPQPKPVEVLKAPEEPAPLKSFGDIFADADQGWYADATKAEESIAPKPRRGGRKVLMMALVGVAAAALLAPIPRTVTTRFTLTPEDDVPVTAPQQASVSAVKVKEGDWVEADAPLFALTSADYAKRIAELDEQIAEFEKKVAPVKRPKKKVKGRGVAPDPDEEVQKTLRKARNERIGLMQKGDEVTVNALISGFVQGLSVKAGDIVAADGPLCRLVASKHLIAKVEVPFGSPIASGQHATLMLSGKKIEVTLENATKTQAEATVDNAEGALQVGGRGEARVSIGAKSFLQL